MFKKYFILLQSFFTKWGCFYRNTMDINEPHKTVMLAQKYFQQENKIGGKAVDLGAGAGRDTLYLLEKGWNVLALDSEQLSIDFILNRTNASHHLEVKVMPFSEMSLPVNLDLINASYSLPFCMPCDFTKCWRLITDQLAIGGRISGQFFGEKDEWATNPDLTIHSHEEFQQLFKEQFVIEYLQIEDGLIPSADGKMKHWHVYHVVAKKIVKIPN